MFRNKKWVVLAVDEHDYPSGDKGLLFKTLDGGNFRLSTWSVNVVLDENLNGTHLVVNGASRGESLTGYSDRYANQAVLYVSTRANKRHWDNYLKNLKEEIEKSESPREVSPPSKSK